MALAMMRKIGRSFCLCLSSCFCELCTFSIKLSHLSSSLSKIYFFFFQYKCWVITIVALLNNINIQQGIHIFQCIAMTHQSLKKRHGPFDQHQHYQVPFSKISSLDRDTQGLYTMYISNLDPTWRILFEHLHLKGRILIFEVALQLKVDWFFFSLSFSITFIWQGERKLHF